MSIFTQHAKNRTQITFTLFTICLLCNYIFNNEFIVVVVFTMKLLHALKKSEVQILYNKERTFNI